jgi:hypothetical protein
MNLINDSYPIYVLSSKTYLVTKEHHGKFVTGCANAPKFTRLDINVINEETMDKFNKQLQYTKRNKKMKTLDQIMLMPQQKSGLEFLYL